MGELVRGVAFVLFVWMLAVAVAWVLHAWFPPMH